MAEPRARELRDRVFAEVSEIQAALEEVGRQRAAIGAGCESLDLALYRIEQQRLRANAAGERILAMLRDD